MTKAELAIALDRALYCDGGPAPTRGVSAADAIDAYIRGLIERAGRAAAPLQASNGPRASRPPSPPPAIKQCETEIAARKPKAGGE